uniref:P2Y purinoceptor 1 n=1 Tax=Oncorhynchus tshawytscha TaxID=74940 RepID=A0AAZ3Q008_ONCTS
CRASVAPRCFHVTITSLTVDQGSWSTLRIDLLEKTGFQFYYLPTVYILVFVTGLVGNSLAIWMFVCHMRPWSSISVYMFNLALADFCYVLSLPFLIFYYFNKTDWIFGDVLCRLQRFIFHVNLYGSILFLTCISVHRYTGVVHPLKSLGRLKKKNAVLTSTLVWVVVIASISPILYYSRTEDELPGYFIYSMCLTVFGFCIPFLLILGCYGMIVKELICNDMSNAPLRRKSIHLVIIVLTVFAVSYLPFHVMKNLNMRARLYFQVTRGWPASTAVWTRSSTSWLGTRSGGSCPELLKTIQEGELPLQSKSEETALNSLPEYVKNGDGQL